MIELREGDELRPLKKLEITRKQLQRYAVASGDKNPIHLDDSFAKNLGFPSVIAHGMLSMAFISDQLRLNFPERDYKLKKFKTRFRKMTFPGDSLICGGTVKKREEGGQILVSLWIKNQNGDITTDGSATVVQM